jgi:ATP-binding cassette subfamily B protein
VAEDAVYEAATIAGADSFIRALPQGYRTLLSGSGSGQGAHLSAGQRQLVALARALVHRPAVVLLDEATAAIDNASDAAFRAALRERVLSRGATVVTVAHRLTTALDADRVIVLDKGRIVEKAPRPRSSRARVASRRSSSSRPPGGTGAAARSYLWKEA